MLNARKIQEFLIFISQSFPKYPREPFSPFIYEYNISMLSVLHSEILNTSRDAAPNIILRYTKVEGSKKGDVAAW